jgi:rhamnosyltransferase
MKKKVAVLLASYNGEAYIMDQLFSISVQSDVKTTVYLSDDASIDSTVATAFSACEKYHQQLSLVLQPRPKHLARRTAANNFYHLIVHVEPPIEVGWVAFADQDDIWRPHHLLRAINALESSGASGYSSSVCAFWPDGSRRYVKKHGYISRYNHLFESPGPGCSIVLPRSQYLALQSHMRANLAIASRIEFHDWAIYAFIRSSGQSWVIDPYPSLYYRQHDSNVLGVQLSPHSLGKRLGMLFGSWYREQCLAVADFCQQSSAEPLLKMLRLTPIDRILLASMAFQLRRRTRDKLMLLFAFFVMQK